MNSSSHTTTLDQRLFIIATALVVMTSLAFAFVGLNVSSFWYDELFTAWVVGSDHDPAAAWTRIVSDLHPPAYYVLIWCWAQIFGTSEAALRTFSALCACGAIVLFVAGTRTKFSLAARLFAAALATCSVFWFQQAQNARDNAFVLLVSTGLLLIEMRLIQPSDQQRNDRTAVAQLGLIMAVSVLVHFYLVLVAVVSVAMIALVRRDLRAVLIAMIAVQVALSYGYLKLVIVPYSMISTTNIWISNSPNWVAVQVLQGLTQAAPMIPMPLIIVCVVAAVCWRTKGAVNLDKRLLVLAAATPVLLLFVATTASAVISPSVIARNLLTAAPFGWALVAIGYDALVPPLENSKRWIIHAGLIAATFVGATILVARYRPLNEPFREAAAWVLAHPACQSAMIPVKAGTRNPGEASQVARMLSYYVHAPLRVDAGDDDGGVHKDGCPVLLWYVHSADGVAASPTQLQAQWSQRLGRPVFIKEFEVYRPYDVFHAIPAEMFLICIGRPAKIEPWRAN